MKPGLTKSTAIVAVASLLTTQVAFGAQPESGLWVERLASLPSSSRPIFDAKQMPRVAPLTSGSWVAARPAAFPSRWRADLKSLLGAFPLNRGSIREVYDGGAKSGRHVILIQDVHLNTEAQSNIAGILEDLLTTGKVTAVGIEGAFDPLHVERLRGYPNKDVAAKILRGFFEANKLAAPSFVALTTQSKAVFVGVDDAADHRENVKAFTESAGRRASLEQKFEEKLNEAEALAETNLNREARAYLRLQSSYKKGDARMSAYVKGLVEYAGETPAGSVDKFLRATAIESSLDFSRVELERGRVLEKLTRKLDRDAVAELVRQTMAYRLGTLSFAGFYGLLQDLCRQQNVSFKECPQFESYLQYVALSDRISSDDLFNELNRLEEKALSRLVRDDREKKVVNEILFLSLVPKLLRFELTPKEWGQYKKLKSQILNPRFQTNSQGQNKNGLRFENLDIVWNLDRGTWDLSRFENFYELADRRSGKMVDNLLKNGNSSVLVVGGFHTPEMTSLLKKKKISYAVVQPKITKIEALDGGAYLNVFVRDKTPLERILSGEKLFINPTDVNINPVLEQSIKIHEVGLDALTARKKVEYDGVGGAPKPDDPGVAQVQTGPNSSGGFLVSSRVLEHQTEISDPQKPIAGLRVYKAQPHWLQRIARWFFRQLRQAILFAAFWQIPGPGQAEGEKIAANDVLLADELLDAEGRERFESLLSLFGLRRENLNAEAAERILEQLLAETATAGLSRQPTLTLAAGYLLPLATNDSLKARWKSVLLEKLEAPSSSEEQMHAAIALGKMAGAFPDFYDAIFNEAKVWLDTVYINLKSNGAAYNLAAFFAKGVLEQASTPRPVEADGLLDEFVRPVETQEADLAALLAKAGAEPGSKVDAVLGRTLRFKAGNRYFALKFSRDGKQAGQDRRELGREARLNNWVAKNPGRLDLRSGFPAPLNDEKDQPTLFRLRRSELPLDVAAALDEIDEKFGIAVREGKDKVYTVYAYVAEPEYFDYLSRPDLPDGKFWDGAEKTIHDLFVFARAGLFHKALIELFHDPEDQARDDGGRYLWMLPLVRIFGTTAGAGEIDGWLKALGFPNARVSGLADGADMITMDELNRDSLPYLFLLDQRYQDKAKNFFLMQFMGDYLMSLLLLVGNRMRQRTEWKSDEFKEKEMRRIQRLFAVAANAFLGRSSEGEPLSWVKGAGNFERLLRQMIFFMIPEAYRPHLDPAKKRSVPQGLYSQSTRVAFGDYTEGSWQEGRLVNHRQNPDGSYDDILGIYSGPLGIEEMVRIFYHFFSRLLFEASRQQSAVAGTSAVPDFPPASDLIFVERESPTAWRVRDSQSRTWFLKLNGETEKEALGYAIAEKLGARVPAMTTVFLRDIKIPGEFAIEWDEYLNDYGVDALKPGLRRAVLVRDVAEMTSVDLAKRPGTGLEEFLVYSLFSNDTDHSLGHNAEIITVNGVDKLIVYDMPVNPFSKETTLAPDGSLVARMAASLDSNNLNEALRILDDLTYAEFNAMRTAAGLPADFATEERFNARKKAVRPRLIENLKTLVNQDAVRVVFPLRPSLKLFDFYISVLIEDPTLGNRLWPVILDHLFGREQILFNEVLTWDPTRLLNYALNENPYVLDNLRSARERLAGFNERILMILEADEDKPAHVDTIRFAHEQGNELLQKIDVAIGRLSDFDQKESVFFRRINGLSDRIESSATGKSEMSYFPGSELWTKTLGPWLESLALVALTMGALVLGLQMQSNGFLLIQAVQALGPLEFTLSLIAAGVAGWLINALFVGSHFFVDHLLRFFLKQPLPERDYALMFKGSTLVHIASFTAAALAAVTAMGLSPWVFIAAPAVVYALAHAAGHQIWNRNVSIQGVLSTLRPDSPPAYITEVAELINRGSGSRFRSGVDRFLKFERVEQDSVWDYLDAKGREALPQELLARDAAREAFLAETPDEKLEELLMTDRYNSTLKAIGKPVTPGLIKSVVDHHAELRGARRISAVPIDREAGFETAVDQVTWIRAAGYWAAVWVEDSGGRMKLNFRMCDPATGWSMRKGTVIDMASKEFFTVGREDENKGDPGLEVFLEFPELGKLSRRHFSVSALVDEQGVIKLFVRDIKSSNGTIVVSEKVRPVRKVVAKAGVEQMGLNNDDMVWIRVGDKYTFKAVREGAEVAVYRFERTDEGGSGILLYRLNENNPRFVIGRRPLKLDDPYVSNEHVVLEIGRPGQLRIRNVSQSNVVRLYFAVPNNAGLLPQVITPPPSPQASIREAAANPYKPDEKLNFQSPVEHFIQRYFNLENKLKAREDNRDAAFASVTRRDSAHAYGRPDKEIRDASLVDADMGIMVTASGAETAPAGEVASKLAVVWLYQELADKLPAVESFKSPDLVYSFIIGFIREAHELIREKQRIQGYGGMQTSLFVAVVVGGVVVTVKIGEVRGYIEEEEFLTEISEGDTKMRLGQDGDHQAPEGRRYPLLPEWGIYTVSPGVWGNVDNEVLSYNVLAYRNPKTAAENLIEKAKENAELDEGRKSDMVVAGLRPHGAIQPGVTDSQQIRPVKKQVRDESYLLKEITQYVMAYGGKKDQAELEQAIENLMKHQKYRDVQNEFRSRVREAGRIFIKARKRNIQLEINRELDSRMLSFLRIISDAIDGVPPALLNKSPIPIEINLDRMEKERYWLGIAKIGTPQGSIHVWATQHEDGFGRFDRKKVFRTFNHELFHKWITLPNGKKGAEADLLFPIADWLKFLQQQGLRYVTVKKGQKIPVEEFLSPRRGQEELMRRIPEMRGKNFPSGFGIFGPSEYRRDPQEIIAWRMTSDGDGFGRDKAGILEIMQENLLRDGDKVYHYDDEKMLWVESVKKKSMSYFPGSELWTKTLGPWLESLALVALTVGALALGLQMQSNGFLLIQAVQAFGPLEFTLLLIAAGVAGGLNNALFVGSHSVVDHLLHYFLKQPLPDRDYVLMLKGATLLHIVSFAAAAIAAVATIGLSPWVFIAVPAAVYALIHGASHLIWNKNVSIQGVLSYSLRPFSGFVASVTELNAQRWEEQRKTRSPDAARLAMRKVAKALVALAIGFGQADPAHAAHYLNTLAGRPESGLELIAGKRGGLARFIRRMDAVEGLEAGEFMRILAEEVGQQAVLSEREAHRLVQTLHSFGLPVEHLDGLMADLLPGQERVILVDDDKDVDRAVAVVARTPRGHKITFLINTRLPGSSRVRLLLAQGRARSSVKLVQQVYGVPVKENNVVRLSRVRALLPDVPLANMALILPEGSSVDTSQLLPGDRAGLRSLVVLFINDVLAGTRLDGLSADNLSKVALILARQA